MQDFFAETRLREAKVLEGTDALVAPQLGHLAVAALALDLDAPPARAPWHLFAKIFAIGGNFFEAESVTIGPSKNWGIGGKINDNA